MLRIKTQRKHGFKSFVRLSDRFWKKQEGAGKEHCCSGGPLGGRSPGAASVSGAKCQLASPAYPSRQPLLPARREPRGPRNAGSGAGKLEKHRQRRGQTRRAWQEGAASGGIAGPRSLPQGDRGRREGWRLPSAERRGSDDSSGPAPARRGGDPEASIVRALRPPRPSPRRAPAARAQPPPPASRPPQTSDNTRSPPPPLPHRMKSAGARPSPCPSSPPPAGLAVAVAVTSRPLRRGPEGEGKEKSQESGARACAKAAPALRPEVGAPPTSARKSVPGTAVVSGYPSGRVFSARFSSALPAWERGAGARLHPRSSRALWALKTRLTKN